MGIEDSIHESDVFSFLSAHSPTSVGQFARNTLGNKFGDTREGADIGGHAYVNFENGQKPVFAHVAHVAGGNKIHTATDCAALYRCKNRHPTLF